MSNGHGTHIDPAATPEWEGDFSAEEAVVTQVAEYTPGEACGFDASILSGGSFASYFECEGDGVDEQGGDSLVYQGGGDPSFASGCCLQGFDLDPEVSDDYWSVSSSNYGAQTEEFFHAIKVKPNAIGSVMGVSSVFRSAEGSVTTLGVYVDASGVVHAFFAPVFFPGSRISLSGGLLTAGDITSIAVTAALSGGTFTFYLWVGAVLIGSDTVADTNCSDGTGEYRVGLSNDEDDDAFYFDGVVDQPVFGRGAAWTQTEVDEYDGCGSPDILSVTYDVDVQKENLDAEGYAP